MGRVLTILYAIIGIPLTFLYLSNMGNFLADCFRLFYKKICCDICCCRQCDKKKIRQRLRNRRRQRYGPVPDDVTVTLDSPTTTECGNYAKTFDQEIMWSKQCEDDVTSPRSVLSVPSSLCLVDEGVTLLVQTSTVTQMPMVATQKRVGKMMSLTEQLNLK